jgi:lipopolysaccharide transport system permease protein
MSPKGPTSALSGIARKRDLWWQFAVRAVEARYRGSYLGILWSVLNPVLMLAIYYVVFGVIFSGHFRDPALETRTDYAMAMFLGLTLYMLVADTLGTGPLLRSFRSPLREAFGSISRSAWSSPSGARRYLEVVSA